jgi:hypothetical protein
MPTSTPLTPCFLIVEEFDTMRRIFRAYFKQTGFTEIHASSTIEEARLALGKHSGKL